MSRRSVFSLWTLRIIRWYMVQSLLRHGPERAFFFSFFFLAKILVRRPPDLPDLLQRHCWFCVGKALWRWFYPRSRKRDHFQTLATGVPKLKTWLGTQRVNVKVLLGRLKRNRKKKEKKKGKCKCTEMWARLQWHYSSYCFLSCSRKLESCATLAGQMTLP